MTTRAHTLFLLLLLLLVLGLGLLACGEDDNGSEADRRGVGAQCAAADDCTEDGQACLTAFKGGYCGVQDCNTDADCPAGSRCVNHDDGNNYCFLICASKDDCNVNRDEANASNCSSSATFVEDNGNRKACVPPSEG